MADLPGAIGKTSAETSTKNSTRQVGGIADIIFSTQPPTENFLSELLQNEGILDK